MSSEPVAMRRPLAGQVVVVTGASRGLGRSMATRFAREGATVACGARSIEQLDATVREIERGGGTGLALPLDVQDDESVAAFGRAVTDRVGTAYALINNAGVMRLGAFADVDVDTWREVLDVNLLGTVRVTRQFLPAMVSAGRGRIINISSTAGKYGTANQASYNASKHAVLGLTKCLALETATAGVRVNAICPGFVDTEMVDENLPRLAALAGLPESAVADALIAKVPIRRFVSTDEVAELAVYLASPLSDAMTGAAVTLAGGLVLI